MAGPAGIANDMAAWAGWWHKRDKAVSRACADCARVIRAAMSGERCDGRTLHGLERRLARLLVDGGAGPEAFRRSVARALDAVARLRSGEAP